MGRCSFAARSHFKAKVIGIGPRIVYRVLELRCRVPIEAVDAKRSVGGSTLDSSSSEFQKRACSPRVAFGRRTAAIERSE